MQKENLSFSAPEVLGGGGATFSILGSRIF